jgi:hypothetical protein
MFQSRKKPKETLTVLTLILELFAFTLPLAAQPLTAQEDPFAQIFAGKREEVTNFADSPSKLPILSEWDGLREWRRSLPRLESNLNVEVLFTLPRPQDGEGQSVDDDSLKRMVISALSQIQKLQGLEYFSATRGRMRLLFKQAFRVPEVFQEQPLRDPVNPNPNQPQEFILFQEDLTFGKNYFQVLLLPLEDGYGLFLQNLNTMFYGILPLVDEGNLLMAVRIGIRPEGLTFYGLSAVKTGSFFGIENSRQDSFYNRIKALFSWFNQNLKE